MVSLAVLRALLNSERFAIIELMVPFVIACLGLRFIGPTRIGSRLRTALNFAPCHRHCDAVCHLHRVLNTSVPGAITTPAAMNLWEFGAMRLLGYYVTSFNNGAYFLQRLDTLPEGLISPSTSCGGFLLPAPS